MAHMRSLSVDCIKELYDHYDKCGAYEPQNIQYFCTKQEETKKILYVQDYFKNVTIILYMKLIDKSVN